MAKKKSERKIRHKFKGLQQSFGDRLYDANEEKDLGAFLLTVLEAYRELRKIAGGDNYDDCPDAVEMRIQDSILRFCDAVVHIYFYDVSDHDHPVLHLELESQSLCGLNKIIDDICQSDLFKTGDGDIDLYFSLKNNPDTCYAEESRWYSKEHEHNLRRSHRAVLGYK